MFLRLQNLKFLTGIVVFQSIFLMFLLGAWAEAAENPASAAKIRQGADLETSKTLMVLGVSWQPGFCEARPKTPECINQTADRIDARQFSLTGLWALRKTYCGVDAAMKEQDRQKKWLDMPELNLEESVRLELARAMPGVASGLDRHEWIKHGTCSGDVAGEYYARSLKLLAALNGSGVQTLFKNNLGSVLREAEIKAAFETAFGPGAGDKVKMRCRRDGARQIITGLTIGLGKAADGGDDLTALITAAGRTKFGCAEGVVDAAGQQ